MNLFLSNLLRRRWLGVVLLLAASLTTIDAQRVTGTVTDRDGAQLPGVTVSVKGTTRGTMTDASGRYAIEAQAGEVIQFAMTGMESQTVTVGATAEINLVLQDATSQLGETVITALGIKEDRRKLSYSTQSVKGEELQSTQRDNAFVSLQGRIAGLSLVPTSGVAGASVNINLRGVNSIGSSNQPLIVLDGLPINSGALNQHNLYSDGAGINGDINNNRDETGSRLAEINPNDIESVTVLKGPEAAALYGNEGANGVIVITTSKGKAGTGQLTYKNRFSMSNIYLFPEIQQVYGRGVNGAAATNDPDYFGPKYEANAVFYDNVDNFFQNGNSMRHDLSFEGGTDRLTYRLSGAYLKNDGVIPTNKYEQVITSLSSDAHLLSWLKASARFSYARTNNVLPPGGAQGYLAATLRYPADQDMRMYLTREGRRQLTLENTTPGADNDNPFFNVYKNARTELTDRTIGNITLDAQILPWWTVTGRFGADIFTTDANRFFHPESRIGYPRLGWTENYTDIGRLLNSNIFTTLKKNTGRVMGSILVGTAFDDRRNTVTSVYGEKVYLPDFNSINNTDPATQRTRTFLTRTRLVGLFAKAEVNLDNWLILNLTGRNDWSSTLPVENRSYFYPSAGLTFVFSDMPGLKGRTGILDFGKIRASFAKVGNPAPPYKIRARLVPQTSTGGGFLYDFFGDNPALKPEEVTSYEVGTDFSLFKGRISVDFAWFSKTISDQIVTQRLSYGTGFIFGLLNGGELNTQGIEIQLGLMPVKAPNFTWNMIANFTKYETEVLSLPAEVSEYYDSDTWVYDNVRSSAFAPADILAARFNSATNRFYPELNSRGAGSATAIGGWSYLRNSKGDILVDPTTGFPLRNANFLPIGDRNPDFVIGLVNEFRVYKNLTLSFLLDIRKGGDIFNGNEFYLARTGLSTSTLDRDEPFVFQGVVKDGQEESDNPTVNTKEIIRSANDQYYSVAIQPEDFVERDINWLRLRDVTLSYTLPMRWFGAQKAIKNLSVFVNGTDLFLITNYTGADPYVSSTTPATGGAGGFGMDFGKISLPRTFSAGLSATF
ncbi:MAG: SusC/RagA family TonB-linked outer membrane protein [Saprospirales bacterium]|nr:SusC/RagA family TonB-linked outer membrane protein [Saprospirales bacterium]